jgi:hypothetical protein
MKDRSAILPSGHMADAAFWFDRKTGRFISSTYYFSEPPGWASDFHAAHPADRYAGSKWMSGHFDQAGEKLYGAVYDSPCANEPVEAECAVEAEKLGQRGVTITGCGREQARMMPGERMPPGIVRDTVQSTLTIEYGEGNWISSPSDHSLYLNLELIHEKKLDRAEVGQRADDAVVTPARVLARQANHQRFHLGFHPGSARRGAVRLGGVRLPASAPSVPVAFRSQPVYTAPHRRAGVWRENSISGCGSRRPSTHSAATTPD